ncbi:hypothetical protein AGMMS50268_17210 [Spirochaetia bacterium]|nr:hypothetical protein AGMMS50268_17210 [Spirochaetia bacterium]
MGYFDGASTQAQQGNPSAEELEKALAAGYGTNSASFINGRAMIPENCETTMVNVVAELKEDCKLFNTMKTVPVASTVHEENRRTSHGDYRFLSTPEGGKSRATDQAVARVFYEQKYLQTFRSITKQMELVRTFEDAYTSEKIAGVETICKGAEFNMFHGDSVVIPTDWDGFPAAIRKSKNPNIIDIRGDSIGTRGESLFDDIARQVWDRGGDISKAFFPAILAKDIKELFTDRIRMMVKDQQATFDQLPDYPTAIGSSIRFSGANTGADKFFHVKGVVSAAGDPNDRPAAPTSVAGAALANQSGSKFLTSDVGGYKYTVYAVNPNGISEGTTIGSDAAVTVAANGGIQLIITPNLAKPVTGYIIARTAKDGSVKMEMVQIGDSGAATTVFVDLNDDLPGTGSMLFLTEKRVTPVFRFGQLLPVSTYPLYPTDKAVTPFLVILYGALEVSAPEFCALVKNIHYEQGL